MEETKIEIYSLMLKLGISEIETNLYLHLLEMGPISISQISHATKIPRTTVYENIERLSRKGLIIQTVRGSRRMFLAENPEKIRLLLAEKKLDLESEQKEMKMIESQLPNLLSSIEDFVPGKSQSQKLDIKYYEGKRAVKSIYHDALKAKEFRAYLNTEEVQKSFPENVELFVYYHNKRPDFYIWEITENTEELIQNYVKKMAHGRYFHKTTPKSLDLSIIDYMLFDGKVAIIEPRGNISGLIIHSDYYYKNALAIFRFIWEMLPTEAISS